MMMLNIGLLAIVAAFNSGAIALKAPARSRPRPCSATSRWSCTGRSNTPRSRSTAVATANADATYQCDLANMIVAGPAENQQTQQLKTCALTMQLQPARR